MATVKRTSMFTRTYRPKTAREVRGAVRSRSAPRIVRWISAAKRQPRNQCAEAETEVADPRIVRLSWTDTLGRPARINVCWLGRAVATDAQVLPFRRGTVDQPPVPVLR